MEGATHPSRPSGSKDIKLVCYGGYVVVTGRDSWGHLFRVEPSAGAVIGYYRGLMRRLAVIDSELGSKKV